MYYGKDSVKGDIIKELKSYRINDGLFYFLIAQTLRWFACLSIALVLGFRILSDKGLHCLNLGIFRLVTAFKKSVCHLPLPFRYFVLGIFFQKCWAYLRKLAS